MNGLDVLVVKPVRLAGPGEKGQALVEGFMRLPLRDRLELPVKFKRGL